MTSIINYDREKRKAAFRRRYLEAGKASDFIGHASDVVRHGDRVVLCCRVSGHVQDRNGNLADQEANLRTKAERLGAIIAGVDRHVGPGWDASALNATASIAQQCGATIILAETTDRLIRNGLYQKDRQHLQATDRDLRELQDCTDGLVLVTDLDPDATPAEVRAYQREGGNG